MESRIGQCTNLSCQYGYSKEPITIPVGEEFKCPNPSCQKPLQPYNKRTGSLPLSRILISLLILAGISLLAFGAFKYVRREDDRPDVPPTPTGTANTSPTRPAGSADSADGSNCRGLPMHKNVWADIQKRRYLIMGVQASAPPMNYSPDREEWDEEHDEKDEEERRQRELFWERSGFDYEMARMIVADMGLINRDNVKAREVTEFKDLFCLLNRQEKDGSFSVDIIMSGIARDPAYDDTISWSRKYAEFGYALVTKKSSHIETLEDCKNKKIGIVEGDNVVKAYVASQLADSEIVELSDESDEWLSDALNLNQVDAVVYDYPFAAEELKGINKQVREQGLAGKLLEIRIADLPGSDLKYVIGVPKGEDELLARINDAIERITDEGNPRYAKLIQQYFRSGDITPVEIPAGSRVYIVKRGDSLSKIAASELNDMGRWGELKTLNNIPNPHVIMPGQRLVLPD